MPRDADEDFPTAAAVVLAGLFVPPLLVAAASGPDSIPVSGRTLVALTAAAFAVVASVVVEARSLDRVNFVVASIVVPWPALLAGVFLVLLTSSGEQIPRGPAAEVMRFLVLDVADLFFYGAAFGLAGVGAVGLPEAVRRA